MEDYPRNLKEFDVRFGSEEACRAYLLQAALAGWLSLSALRVPREFAG